MYYLYFVQQYTYKKTVVFGRSSQVLISKTENNQTISFKGLSQANSPSKTPIFSVLFLSVTIDGQPNITFEANGFFIKTVWPIDMSFPRTLNCSVKHKLRFYGSTNTMVL